jgi:hypothetical protein
VPHAHYDSHIYINCHQSFSEQRVISEQNAGEPTPWQNICCMDAVRITRRLGSMFGARGNSVDPLVGTTPFTPPLSPSAPGGEFADWWLWDTAGHFSHPPEDD